LQIQCLLTIAEDKVLRPDMTLVARHGEVRYILNPGVLHLNVEVVFKLWVGGKVRVTKGLT
jgi:hypothetical protein